MSGVILKAWSTVGLLRSGVKTRSDVNAPLISASFRLGYGEVESGGTISTVTTYLTNQISALSPRSGRWRKAWGVSPRDRGADVLSPASRARSLLGISSWGLRPRLYASVRFADSSSLTDSSSM